MTTRQSELLRVLNELAAELPTPEWIALVDENGLIMACIPDNPPVEAARISAMAATSVMMAERVLKEIDGGKARFASLAGSRRQHLTVVLGPDRLLSIGLGPHIAAQETFGPLSRKVPALMEVLRREFKAG
jgi:predicted regulator of Ras-like GTPase activity (Roadblock/LC7/MglB family)